MRSISSRKVVRQIRRYEAGEQQPLLSVAIAIADALGITAAELAGKPSHRIKLGGRAANEGSIRSKGTMYFVLHPYGLNMSGRWVGLGYDGRIMTGWAAMGQTQEEAEDTMQKLIASEGVPYVDD